MFTPALLSATLPPHYPPPNEINRIHDTRGQGGRDKTTVSSVPHIAYTGLRFASCSVALAPHYNPLPQESFGRWQRFISPLPDRRSFPEGGLTGMPTTTIHEFVSAELFFPRARTVAMGRWRTPPPCFTLLLTSLTFAHPKGVVLELALCRSQKLRPQVLPLHHAPLEGLKSSESSHTQSDKEKRVFSEN